MIRRFLDLSSAHLDQKSKDWLDKYSGAPDMSVAMLPYGWFGYAPETVDDLAAMPEVLRNIALFARKAGCEYLLFDSDGASLAGLPVFDEDTGEECCADGELIEIDIRKQPCEHRGVDRGQLHPDLRLQCLSDEEKARATADFEKLLTREPSDAWAGE